MLTQIYEITTPEEALACAAVGVDHLGLLVGPGEFPREISIAQAQLVISAVAHKTKISVLSLSAHLDLLEQAARELRPDILHIGAAIDLVFPEDVKRIKVAFPEIGMMRAIPIVGEEAVTYAQSYDGIADWLLLDSHIPGDKQIGAVGKTHDWSVSRAIVQGVHIPVILAGGLGPENVADAIRSVRPAGVDSKTKTDSALRPHTKDLEKVRSFVHRARSA